MSNDLNRIQTLCEQLNEEFTASGAIPFQATIKITKSTASSDWRYDLLFQGGFSRQDLNMIDRIAQTVDCYYELSGGDVGFVLSLPYGETLREAQDKR